MAMHGQASSVLMVCQIEKLLKQLRIEDTHKKIEARVIVRNESEQRNLLFAQRGQVKLIGGSKPRKAFEVELFKPCGKGNLDTL